MLPGNLLGFLFFDHSLVLAGKENLLILQKGQDKYFTGAGVDAASVWTPAVDPEWTANEWVSYWLVFSDRRFRIVSNTTTALTVDLATGPSQQTTTLPSGSNTGEIMRLIEWYPVRKDLGIDGGALSPMNTNTIFQSVFVSRIPVTGR